MQLGMVGLGRMGANLVRRLMRDGHECVVYDVNADAVQGLVAEGATGAATLSDFVAKLTEPRAAWVMVPAAFAGKTVTDLAALMSAGDIVIDGGNTYYRDDIDRAEGASARGIHYVDVGTSGGVFGLERGFCLMIGGETRSSSSSTRSFATLPRGAAPRTPGRTGEPSTAEEGYLHCGPAGAGHFVKMVHNGIEYGMMAPTRKGSTCFDHANAGREAATASDAETTRCATPSTTSTTSTSPRSPRSGAGAAWWPRGCSTSPPTRCSRRSPTLDEFSGRVSDSGEGRWTSIAAIDEGVPAHVLSAALFDRFESRGEADFADKILSAMRKEFGGHAEPK